jgi:hypothetical protein
MKPLPSPGHVHTFDWQWSDWVLGLNAQHIAEHQALVSRVMHAPPRETWFTEPVLSADAVREIRVRLAEGEPQKAIARDYGCHQTTISSVATGRTWRHAS